jgi:hypothetical protein
MYDIGFWKIRKKLIPAGEIFYFFVDFFTLWKPGFLRTGISPVAGLNLYLRPAALLPSPWKR